MQIPVFKMKIDTSTGKVVRRWRRLPDETYYHWHTTRRHWRLRRFNAIVENTKRRGWILSIEGSRFYLVQNSVTLEDFFYEWEGNRYIHIGTGLSFKTRQITKDVFRDLGAWPELTGRIVSPATFIRRYHRVPMEHNTTLVLGEISQWANAHVI